MSTGPWTLSVVMLLIPALLVGSGFALTFLDAYWVRAFPLVAMAAALIQGVSFLVWEWVVATRLVRVSGERPGISIRLFKLAFASAPIALASIFALGFSWPTVPEVLLIIPSAVGTAGVLYGLCFVASVVVRAELGPKARTWHVIIAALSLWAWSPLTACLMQRSVKRVFLRASEVS